MLLGKDLLEVFACQVHRFYLCKESIRLHVIREVAEELPYVFNGAQPQKTGLIELQNACKKYIISSGCLGAYKYISQGQIYLEFLKGGLFYC